MKRPSIVKAGAPAPSRGSVGKGTLLRKPSVKDGTLLVDFDAFDQSLIVPLDMAVQDQPVFHWRIFLEQWCWQVLFPLSLPFIFLFRGYNAVVNMRYIPSKEQIYVSAFQWLLAGSVLGMVILFPFAGYDLDNGGQKLDTMFYFLAGELALAVMGAVFQRSAVATKYSYLPLKEYLYIMRRLVTFSSLQGDQIVNAWLNLADNAFGVLDRELSKAQKRLGIDAGKVYLHLTVSKLKYLEAETCTLESVGCIAEDVPEEELVGYLQANQRDSNGNSPELNGKRGGRSRTGSEATDNASHEKEDTFGRFNDGSCAVGIQQTDKKSVPTDASLGNGRPSSASPRSASAAFAAARSPISSLAANKRISVALKQAAQGLRTASSAASGRRIGSQPGLLSVEAPVDDGGAASEEPEVWKRISAYALAKLLVVSGSQAQKKNRDRVSWALFVACIGGSLLNVIIRAASGLRPFGNNGVQTAFFVLSMYSTFWHAEVYSTYLFVAALDVQRRTLCLKKLGELAMLSAPSQVKLVQSASDAAAATASAPTGGARGQRAKRATAIFTGVESPDGRGRSGSSMSIEMMTLDGGAALPPTPGSKGKDEQPPRTPLPGAAASQADLGRSMSTSEITMAVNPLSLQAAAARGMQGPAGDKSAPSSPAAPPRRGAAVIPLDNCENVVAWLMTRRMLRAFGMRYVARLTAYTGQGVVLTLLILVAILTVTLQGLAPTLGAAAIGLAATAIFYLVLLSTFILLLLLYGAEGNGESQSHCGILAARNFEAKQAAAVLRRSGFDTEAQECQDVAGVLKAAQKILMLEVELDPIRVLGLRASYQLLGSIAVSTASAILSAANLLRTSFAPTS